MDPMVESAFIAAAATLVGVGGTVTIAIVSVRISRSTNQATIDASHADIQRTLEAAREGQLADRYSRALEQVGSPNLDVRCGAIYALEGIARDSPRDHPTVMEVLTAFIREHSREQWPPPEPDGTEPERSTRPDVQAAIAVVWRRDAERDVRPIDLTRADLTSAHLPDAKLAKASLVGAILIHAILKGADLREATLHNADLTYTYLRDADLTGASLGGAKLPSANLHFAHLADGELEDANLAGANLAGANLAGASLPRAILVRTYLMGADLTNACLNYANLTDANLNGAHLAGAEFTDADLTGARWPQDASVPEGWKLDTGSGLLKLEEADSDSDPTEAN